MEITLVDNDHVYTHNFRIIQIYLINNEVFF